MSPVPTRSRGSDDDTRQLFLERRRRARWSPWRWVAGAVVVLGLVAAAVWLVFFSSVLAVSKVQVTGADVLATADVREAARVPEGRPLARVDVAAIERRVEALAAVRDATVTRAWPDGIRIEVDERVAIAVVVRGDKVQGLDADGIAFRTYEEPPTDLPLVQLGEGADAEAVVEAARVVAAMPADTAAEVASIAVTSVDQIDLALRDGSSVVWGSAEDSDAKGEVLAVLLAQDDLDVEEYDVSVPARPTTR
ncbi:cell division protein FtsQ/DivIB [Nocardioides zeae]